MTDYDGKDRPEHYELPDGDERTELRNGIVRALYALPMHFTSPINVEGIEVNDLFSINTLLGGKPVVYEPYVEQAKFASDMRTYYWNHRRGDNSKRDCGIHHPETTPYPKPGTQYVDVPNQDGGGNFGRIARVDGLMANWVDESMDTLMAGIEAKYWVSFFKLFSEGRPKEEIEAELSNIARKVRQAGRPDHKASMLEEQLLAHLSAIVDLSLK